MTLGTDLLGRTVRYASPDDIKNAIANASFVKAVEYLQYLGFIHAQYSSESNKVSVWGVELDVSESMAANGEVYTTNGVYVKNAINSKLPRYDSYILDTLKVPQNEFTDMGMFNRAIIYGKEVYITGLNYTRNNLGSVEFRAQPQVINDAIKNSFVGVRQYLTTSKGIPHEAILYHNGKLYIYGKEVTIPKTLNIDDRLYSANSTVIDNALSAAQLPQVNGTWSIGSLLKYGQTSADVKDTRWLPWT